MTARPSPLVRWRALTPAQAVEVRKARQNGARVADLAAAYGVTVRTIYRELRRAGEPTWEVVVDEFRATFQVEGGRPVQVTPWVAR